MDDRIAVPSSLIAPKSERRLTPAMLTVLWELGAVLDEQRVEATVTNSVWLELPTVRLRGVEGRTDNVWLTECLNRLMATTISGSYRGDAWAAVVVSEYTFLKGGTMVRVLIPPAAIRAIRTPRTFAKIEVDAAHRLPSSARRLYAILADRKHSKQPYWTYSLEEIKTLLGVLDRPAYDRWSDLKVRVLSPAVVAINEFGTVSVTMTPQKVGKSVVGVKFEWRWKTHDEARETIAENERHSMARGLEPVEEPDAPPLTDVVQASAVTEVRIEPRVESATRFPEDGPIVGTAFEGFCRTFGRGSDPNLLAEQFRNYAREHDRPLVQKEFVSFLSGKKYLRKVSDPRGNGAV